MDMTPVLTQMGILVFIMAVGFVCTKLGVTGPEFTRSGSKVVLNVLLVFTILNSVTSAELELSLADIGIYALGFFVMIGICMLLGLIMARIMRLGPNERGIAAFAVAFTNTVFVGFPVVESVFGAGGVLIATISNIPFNLFIYTLGVMLIDGSPKAMSLKSVLSPPMIATLIAIAFLLTGWELPAPVVECFSVISAGTVPMSMLVVGASLGSVSIKESLGNWRVYVVSLVRLIIGPLAVWAVLRPFIHDEMFLGVVVILAACPVAMLATALTIRCGKDEAFASECVFVSTVLAAVNLPLMTYLLV